MKPVSTHLCALTEVSGHFGNSSSMVVVHNSTGSIYKDYPPVRGTLGAILPDESGASWKLGAYQTADNSLSGSATCVPLSNFNPGPNGTVSVSSEVSVINLGSDNNDCFALGGPTAALASYESPMLMSVRGNSRAAARWSPSTRVPDRGRQA